MKMLRKALRLIPVGVVAALVAACAPTKQISDVKPMGSFLPDPSLLQSGKDGQAALVYLNPNANWPSYNKMMLQPVTIWLGDKSSLSDIPPERRQKFADALFGELYNAASTRCTMVDAPATGAINVRFAIMDAEASNPTLNTISTYVPQARLLSTLGGYAFNSGAGVFTGSATIEAYATDATTGELLWQAVDKRAGANAIGSDTFNSWADVDNAFKAWAKQFGVRMTDLGVCVH